MSSKHLIVDISGHGYGHLSQIATVLNDLALVAPSLRVTVRTPIQASIIKEFLSLPFDVAEGAPDFGLAMLNPYEVDVAASVKAFSNLHRNFSQLVDEDAVRLATLDGDLHLSNIGFLSLAAAKHIGLPSIALGCLNWIDVAEPFIGEMPEFAHLRDEIRRSYDQASLFLTARPFMPMDWLTNRRSIGPLGRCGKNQRAVLERVKKESYYVLVSMGGIPSRTALPILPVLKEICWVVNDEWGRGRDDVISVSDTGLSFIDLVASCDALLTKPGYGAFVEAACNGTRVLYVDRGTWPESPYLERWLQVHGVCQSVDRSRFETGDWRVDLCDLLGRPPRPKISPSGVAEAVAAIKEFL